MKKLLSVLLSALMVLSLVPAGVFVFTAAAAEVGETDWSAVDAADVSGHMLYINSADDWSAFLGGAGTYDGATVYLCQSIDVSAVTGVGPIADFKGTFEGQDFTVTGIKTGLFTTLSGSVLDVTLNLAYNNASNTAAVAADMIKNMNGTLSNVTVTGYLHTGTSGAGASSGNVALREVNGTVNNLTFDGLEGYTGGNGLYISNINSAAKVDGLTFTGKDASVWRAVGVVYAGSTVKNVTVKSFNRTVFGLTYGTIDNVTVDAASDITFREPQPGTIINNLVYKNVTSTGYSMIYPSICNGLVINGLTVDNTTTVPLFYPIAEGQVNVSYMHANLTINNAVVNNGAAIYFGDVRGTINGLTVNGNTSSVISKVTGTVKNVVTNGIGAPVIVGEAIEIATADDWRGFLSNSTYTYEGVTVKLMNTIDVSSVTGAGPIADFKGTFDGQGFAVNNIKTKVFTTVSGTVKNATFNVSYHEISANLITTLAASGTLTNLTFTGTLHERNNEDAVNYPNFANSRSNSFIEVIDGTISDLTIHNARAYHGADYGTFLQHIKGTARITNLTFSGSDTMAQNLLFKVYGGAVINNLVFATGTRMGLYCLEAGATVNGFLADNHNEIIVRDLHGTINDLVVNGRGAGTNMIWNSGSTGTINNLTIKNTAAKIINDWPTNVKLTGNLIMNNASTTISGTAGDEIGGKLVAGYFSDAACTQVIENLGEHSGDAYVKFVDPAMVAVQAQLKKQNDGKYTIRFLTTVDRLDGYESVKISITRDGKEGAYGKEMTTVYSSVLANGVPMDAEDVTGVADSKYIATYEIRNIPAEAVDTVFNATATVTMADGSTITSTSGGAITCWVSGLPGYTA